MAQHKVLTFPQLSSEKRQLDKYNTPNYTDIIQLSEERGKVKIKSAIAVNPTASKKVCETESNYLYAGPGRKPGFLKQLEQYVRRELHTIDTNKPKIQELKLQVYRNAFSRFIEEFKTYQPLLDAIQKEYENTLVHLQDQIQELAPLRSRLRLVTEECDRKLLAYWEEEQAKIRALEEEKQQLQKDMEGMREGERSLQVVVSRLQSDLSSQYLQYREVHDSRKLLLLKLNELTSCFLKEEGPSNENTYGEDKDPVKLKVALNICREDLTKAQMELNRIQAEYWDVVPRRDWDALEHTHKQTSLQLERLQGDFDQLKSEYDTLLEVHKRDSIQAQKDCSIATQESMQGEQSQPPFDLLTVLINSDASESGILTVQDFRLALSTAFPLKAQQAIDELVAAAQAELDSHDSITYQQLYSTSQEADGAHGEFLNLVRRQYLEERQVYISQLREQLEGKGMLSVADMRDALMSIDPALDSDALEHTLSLAFQVNKEELNLKALQLDIEVILQCLSVAD